MRYLSFVLLLMILLFGCEEKHFTRVFDTSVRGAEIKSVRLSVTDPKLRRSLTKLLYQEGIGVTDRALYTLEAEAAKYPKHCNNPLTCTYDATYDGFMKIRLLRQMHPLYMTQQEYHGVFHPEDMMVLVERMYDDLNLKR
ncbi:MAG: hypothetical protein DSZ05_09240 [Sulfurospirillum sp.]|nr:MAG: hypothetical protein DSZ05_09240 [Sulfurospirillum sp.]